MSCAVAQFNRPVASGLLSPLQLSTQHTQLHTHHNLSSAFLPLCLFCWMQCTCHHTALFAQAEDGDSAATSGASALPAAAISAYQSEGMRMIGLLRRSAFQPIMPALSEDMIARM
jgi:hypothetical protein